MHQFYIVRHCQAEGQEPTARLSAEGRVQALQLSQFLKNIAIDQVITSPYTRAVDSIRPLLDQTQISVRLDQRLEERKLCGTSLPDWKERLQESFIDLEICLEGGESSRTAMQRGVAVIKEVLQQPASTTLLVSHGNLISLILKYFDDSIGYETWATMSNPDVYHVMIDGGKAKMKRIWNG